MKRARLILIIIFFLFSFFFTWTDQVAKGAHWAGNLSGYILLQVEKKGEAWYVNPATGKRYYMGRPADAFNLMRRLSLGARHEFISKTQIFPENLSGRILLDVEKNGEAYYIYPLDKKKYYLGRPSDAFRIMRELGKGISNADLINIPEGHADEQPAVLPNSKSTLLDVPFTSQAPFGNWSDQRQQDGCEESSSLMAMKWVRGEKITKEEALKNITGVSDYLLKKYGEYRDIAPSDMIKWIFNDYYDYDKVFLVKDISVNDIINALNQGHLVLTPMNGQIMHNPYYKSPGPPRHMIVIRGYDPAARQFITNDPGTRNGELYRYDAKVLFEAIRDYPTGYHETIYRIEKTMIVVEK
jgi:hypothetical protein